MKNLITFFLLPLSLVAAVRPYEAHNIVIHHEAGRFGGWPANHGIWSWGNEILAGFSAAWFQRQNPEVHQYDRSKPEEPRLARTLDGGLTWTEGRDSQFPNPNAAVDLLKLAGGSLLLIFNDSMVERTPLTLALSKNGGRSWPIRRSVAVGPNDYAYPYPIQGRDGSIHVVYTSNSRTVINHAVFHESWIEGR